MVLYDKGSAGPSPKVFELAQGFALRCFLRQALVVVMTGGIVGGCALRVDGPDFEEQATVQAGVAFGYLRGFVEVVSENEPIAADHFLGFAKRAVCYHFLPHDRFTFICEPLPAFHFSLTNQSIKPGIELVDCLLYFIPREGSVPVSPGNYQVFGWRRSFVHVGLSSRLV